MAAGANVVLVDAVTGMRTLLSDFTDPLLGATGVAQNIAGIDCDSIYVTDHPSVGGKLIRVLPDGTRTVVSDPSDVAQGPAWYSPLGLGHGPVDGSVLVTDRGQGNGTHAGLWSVDKTTGFRTLIIDSGSLNKRPFYADERRGRWRGGNISSWAMVDGPTRLGGAADRY